MTRSPAAPRTSRHPAARPGAAVPEPAHGARVQMADIARLANVSVATVSRALSDSKLVSLETRERIQALARSLNYSIDVGAQNLRLRQNRTISVVIPYDPASRQQLSDPFFLSLIGSLADELTSRGHEMLLSRVDVTRLDLAVQAYETRRAAGVILIGQWHMHGELNELARRDVPFVVWGAEMPGQAYVTVGSDNRLGGRLATGHLLDQGATRVAFLGDPSLPEIKQRHRGWQDAHRARGLEAPKDLVLPAPFDPAAMEAAVRDAVQAGLAFDGLFAASDVAALTAILALRRLKIAVPRQVRVCGYDDIPAASLAHPALTTIRQPIEAAGERLVASLLARLAGHEVKSSVLPTELVIRDSSVTR